MYYEISRGQLKVADSYFHAQHRGEGLRTLPARRDFCEYH